MPVAIAAEEATPIWISRRTRQALAVVGVCAAALLLWHVPELVSLFLGGAALAVALSFPTARFSRTLPRSVAIALTMVLTAALLVLAITVVAPIIAEQLRALVAAVPGIAGRIESRFSSMLDWLAAHGLLAESPERALADAHQRFLGAARELAGRLLGGLGRIASGIAGVVVALVGIVVVAGYLLADARRIRAGLLRASPRRYRRDVRALLDAFSQTISRYLGGLALSMVSEGALAAIAFHVLGVPYAFLLGAWVCVAAVIPYVGAWIGYAPGVVLAFAISPTRALVALLACLAINLVESNVISPRIQGQAVHVHPMLLFFSVIAGGKLFGMAGVVLAVPAMAVLRVLFDFLRVRVRVVKEGPTSHHSTTDRRDEARSNDSGTERQPRVNDLERRPA